MDFFAHQARAKKRSLLYVFLFVLALIGIVGVTYLIFAWINAYAIGGPSFDLQDLWVPELFSWVTLVTLLIVGVATLWKISQLKAGGGAYVAEMMGGRLVEPGTKNPQERKVLNIVEEVAIAAGIPTPPVYLMDREPGINAFAAGYSPDSAVVGITQGTIEILNRDELQGVIAHEFSHILNGDMRINIRLIGALFGIMALGLLGYYTLRTSMMVRQENSRGGGALVLVFVGIGLMAIGFVGTFFGHLIKAAVSRQREFLADASAVQFTRNPEGIGNALRKIRDYEYGSKVVNPHAAEVSHMLFARGVFSGFTSLFSTHPPMSERIERIFGVDTEALTTSPPPPAPTMADLKPTKEGIAFLNFSGQPDIEQIVYAKKLVGEAPLSIKNASKDPFGARAVIYGLLLSHDPKVREHQLDMLSTHSYVGVFRELIRLLPEIGTIDYAARIPLVDNSIPALTMLSKSQYEVFRSNIQELIYTDQRIDLFEWVLEKMVVRHLDAHFKRPKKAPRGVLLENSTAEIRYLLGVLSSVGHNTPEAFEEALTAGLEKFGLPYESGIDFELNFRELNRVVEHLDQLGIGAKKKLLEACMECIHYDKKITVYEAELFRGIGDALGIPVPLLVPSV